MRLRGAAKVNLYIFVRMLERFVYLVRVVIIIDNKKLWISDRLKKCSPSRIISLSSVVHTVGNFNINDPNYDRPGSFKGMWAVSHVYSHKNSRWVIAAHVTSCEKN